MWAGIPYTDHATKACGEYGWAGAYSGPSQAELQKKYDADKRAGKPSEQEMAHTVLVALYLSIIGAG